MAEKKATLWLQVKETGAKAIDALRGSLDLLGTAFKYGSAALTAFTGLIAKAAFEYKQKEDAIRQLDQAMVNNGIYTRALANEYHKLADQLAAKSLFDDDQIIKAQAVVQQQVGQTKVTKELTQAIMDFAQAQGMDLSRAAEVVGKSIGSSTNALSRYGIQIADGTSKSERMQAAIDGLNKKFGGQAEAATEGIGVLSLFQKTINNVFEDIGKKVSPTLVAFVGYWNKWIQNSPQTKTLIDDISKSFSGLVKVTIKTIEVVRVAWDTMISGIGTVAMAMTELVQGNFKAAWQAIKNGVALGMQEVKQTQIIAAQDTADQLKAIDEAVTKAKQNELNKQAENARKAKQNEELVLLEELAKEEALWQERENLRLQRELEAIGNQEISNENKLKAKIKSIDDELKTTTDHYRRLELEAEKSATIQKLIEEKKNKAIEQDRDKFLGQLAGLQSSSNSTLAALGKAAAIFQIQLEGHKAAASALAWGTSLGGPPLGKVFEMISYAATAAQIAQVAGLKLAEGGIVMPRPGGVQATIAEAGQAEAVIPLDRAGEFGLGGGGITINVYGGLMGDQSSAREFAVAIDRELYNLRKNNESLSFEGII